MRKQMVLVLLFFVTVLYSYGVWAMDTKGLFNYKFGGSELILLPENQGEGSDKILIGATDEMKRNTIPDGTFPNAVNAFLLKTPEKNILIDSGLGRNLFNNLKTAGIANDKIDIVLITHMHGDHIGGMMQEGNVAFPNAEVYIAKMEYDYWMSEEEMNRIPESRRGGFLNVRKFVEAYKSKIHIFEPQEMDESLNAVLPGIYPLKAYGHTPGHVMFLLESGEDKLMVWGDLTHAMAIQMSYPEVAVTYDVNPKDAVSSRKKALKYISDEKIPVAGMHVAYPGMGVVKQDEKNTGYIFTPMK